MNRYYMQHPYKYRIVFRNPMDNEETVQEIEEFSMKGAVEAIMNKYRFCFILKAEII